MKQILRLKICLVTMYTPKYQKILLFVAAAVLVFSVIYFNVFICGSPGNPTCYGKGTWMELVEKNVTILEHVKTYDCNLSEYNESRICHFKFKLRFTSADSECIIADAADDPFTYYYDKYLNFVEIGHTYPILFDSPSRPCDLFNPKFNRPTQVDFWLFICLMAISSFTIFIMFIILGLKWFENRTERKIQQAPRV